MAPAAPVAHRLVPSSGSTAMSTASPPCLPTFSPMKSMGASSRSPSPITIVPSTSTLSSSRRMASTAAASEPLRSPRPMVRADAIAARSTTLTNSNARSAAIIRTSGFRDGYGGIFAIIAAPETRSTGRGPSSGWWLSGDGLGSMAPPETGTAGAPDPRGPSRRGYFFLRGAGAADPMLSTIARRLRARMAAWEATLPS